jgi:multimeric flavodoxin WrbA
MAELMLNAMAESINDLRGEVVALVDKRIEPCIGCAGCVGSGLCTISDDFGSIYAAMKTADALIFVSPHYAPIPAKLCALLERVESIAFLNRWNNPDWPSPLLGKPCALVGHGGAAGDEMQKFYNDVVLIPLKNALGYPVEAKIVTVAEWPHIGVVTGPAVVRKGELFPIQEYDWDNLTAKLRRLAEAMACELAQPS